MNKRNELQACVDIHDPDVIGITEVKPKNSRYAIQECELALKGYELFHNLTEDGRGLAMYVKSEMKPSVCDAIISTFSEHIFVECRQSGGEKMLLGLIYRSPNSPAENTAELNKLMLQASALSAGVTVIMGDFNFPEINWETELSAAGPGHVATTFLKATKDCFFVQHQKEPTRYRQGEKANVVDLVFTNGEEIISDISTIAGLGKSDHFSLLITLNSTVKQQQNPKRPNFNKTDFEALKQILAECSWDELQDLSVNDTWARIKEKICDAINRTTPLSGSGGRKGKSWMDRGTLDSVRKKHKLFRRWQETRDGQDYMNYIKERNKARKACRKAQRNLENKVASEAKTNPRAFWQYVKTKTQARSGVADLKKKDGTKTKTDEEKAELLNEFFQSVFTTEGQGPVPETNEYTFNEELTDFGISVEVVRKLLAGLHIGKASGPDGIPPSVLAKAADELAEPIAQLFRKSLAAGQVPDEWKTALVTPVFKKGSKSSANNYRPVSLTCIICKTMEKLVREQILDHLQKNNLITKNQHGFVPGRSTITQLLECLDIWTSILDEGGTVDAIYMDYQKAFDSVPHQRLLAKISSLGIRGNVRNWIQSFLSGRRQKVVVGGAQSKEADVTSGIPQGSVLGPILFVMFINDLPENIKTNVKMFADDTKLYTRSDIEGNVTELQEDLNRLQEWSDKWLLKFHPEKCSVLKIGREKSEATYYMNKKETNSENVQETKSIVLGVSEVEKDLGVMIDSKLSFKDHVAYNTAKANRMVGIIRRTFDHLTEKTFVQLYKSMVRPLLEYGHCVWQPQLKTLCSDIEDVQRRATKLISSLKDKPYPERLKALKLPCLEHRRHRGDLIEVYKYTHGYYDVERPCFNLAASRELRGNSLKIQKNQHRLNVRANFFSERIVTAWNSLPDAVVTAPSIVSFKSRLDSHWINLPTLYAPMCQNMDC
jgi:hypothetical protein